MALRSTPHHENGRCLPRVEGTNHVGGPYWYRESDDKLTGELPVPRIVAFEHAEQSRDADAPACARRTLAWRCGDGASPRAVRRVGRPQEDGGGLRAGAGRTRGPGAGRANVRHHYVRTADA